MKKIKIVLLSLAVSSFVACSSNDDTEDVVKDCVTCNAVSDPIEGVIIPKKEICKGANGNAFIQGTDTTIEYNKYIEIQRKVTTCQ